MHIRQGKTRSARRTLPLTEVASHALGGLERGAPDALVFATRNGTALSARNVLRAWHAFSERVLGRRLSFHALRHSAATLTHPPGRAAEGGLGRARPRRNQDHRRHSHVEALDALKADAAKRIDGIFQS